MYYRYFLFCLSFCLVFISSNVFADNDYELAIMNTALHKIPNHIAPLMVIQQNPIRMVTFTNEDKYKTTDKKIQITTWTCVESELKKLCTDYAAKNHPTHQQLTLWIAQLVGLPPYETDKYRFVVLDVPAIQAYYGASPNNDIGIFRPCTDPRIGLHAGSICPARMDFHNAFISSEYKTWFINYTMDSYTLKRKQEKNNYSGFPWTGDGYTYNWNPRASNIFGASEFVVLKNTPVTILKNPQDKKTAYISPEQYCS